MNDKQRYLDRLKIAADRQRKSVQKTGDKRLLKIFDHACTKLIDEDNPYWMAAFHNMKRVPVSIEEFIESDDFLGSQIDLWPIVRDDIVKSNPDILAGEPEINELILGGAQGWGKTTIAHATCCYQAYVATCYKVPQKLFLIAPSTRLIFTFQSISKPITSRVIYQPFREMFLGMPYIKKYVQYDKKIESELRLENNIQVIQVLANVESIIAQAIVGCIIDEINWMPVVMHSKRVYGARGEGGIYDQAQQVYNMMTKRRKSRFITQGPTFGTICIISSAHYKDDFTSRRVEQVKQHNEKSVVVISRRQFETFPKKGKFSGENFRVLVGNEDYPSRVLKPDELSGINYPEGSHIEHVPMEYYYSFANDTENAIREILGFVTANISPFFAQRNKIYSAINYGKELGLKSWVTRQNIDLFEHGMPQIIRNNLPKDLTTPRFIGVDLSHTRDAAGIAIGKPLLHVAGDFSIKPRIVIEEAISIKPSTLKPLEFSDVREWILQLKTVFGIPIRMVVYDRFASTESIQLLRKAGVHCKLLSVDSDADAYTYMRELIYDDRLALIENEVLLDELLYLEYDKAKDKVDHPPRKTKDIADAACRLVYAAANSRMVRSNTSPTSDIYGGRRRIDSRRNVRDRKVGGMR